MQTLSIAGFGLLGVLSRHLIDVLVMRYTSFPPWIGTWGINLIGAFVAGFVFILASERMTISAELQTALLVGLAGGFTTFSTYCLQALALLEKGEWPTATFYLLFSPLTGVLIAFLGASLARRI